MKLVSYAQNQEDIMLHRALRDVVNGFYIDVGAQQPALDSVTKLFYDLGWAGINIDPMPQWHEMLTAERPHDINLQMAVSDHAGNMTFYGIPDTGLSTADHDLAKRHEGAGYTAHEINVEVRTLDDICAAHDVHTVHFLKIDVEGAEQAVISGFSFEGIRPWIVLVEAVEPVAQRADDGALEAVMTHEVWEPLLLERDYDFVYWDGLNRFYVAREHAELAQRFSAPPNPFDGFVRYSEIIKGDRIDRLEAEHRELVDAGELVARRRELGDFQGLVETAQNRLQRIADLEQDNARLVGRASVHEEQVRDSVTALGAELSRLGELKRELSHVGELRQQLSGFGELKEGLARIGQLQDEISRVAQQQDELFRVGNAHHQERRSQLGALTEELSRMGGLQDEISRVAQQQDELFRVGDVHHQEKLSQLDALKEELSRMGGLQDEISRVAQQQDELFRVGDAHHQERLSQLGALKEELSRMGGLHDEISRVAQQQDELFRVGNAHHQERRSRLDELQQELIRSGEVRHEQELSRMGELREELSGIRGILTALESANQQVRLAEARLKKEQAWSQTVSKHVKQEQTKLAEVQSELQQEQSRARDAIARVEELSDRNEQLEVQCDQYEANLRGVHGSWSWRMTKPLRWLFRRERGEAVAVVHSKESVPHRSLLRRGMQRLLFASARFLNRHRQIRRLASWLGQGMPSLSHRLRAFDNHNAAFIYPNNPVVLTAGKESSWVGSSTPEADVIHARLRAIISSKPMSTNHE